MKITKSYIMQHKTKRGAWTQPQLEALGVSWPPRKGWMNEVIGKDIDEHDQRIFESQMTIRQQRKQNLDRQHLYELRVNGFLEQR